jgi:hypothetical protein
MKKIIITVFFFSFFVGINSIRAQGIDNPYFFSTDKVFVPTRSSVFEPRVGFVKNINNKYLRLDIGAGIDLIGMYDEYARYSFGIDAFTFSNLRSESNFKFPVDAIDYFFGVNINSKRILSDYIHLSSRLRISHISSHLEDGHLYERSDTVFTPFTYSREFINLAVIIDHFLKKANIRNLFGIDYLFSTIPADFGTFTLQYGFEFQYYIHGLISLYFSNDLKLATVNNKTKLNENLEAGIRIGEYGSRGLNLFFTYYDGQDYKGQYYDRYLNYKAFGFSVDY